MIKIILFDWDDVITLGSKEGYFACYDSTLQTLGITLDKKEQYKRILDTWGKTYRDALEALLKEQPQLIDTACKIYEQELFSDTYIHELYLLDGMVEALILLSKKYKLAIASGIHPDLLKNKVIPKLHIPNVFSEMIFSYDIPDPAMRKPHPYTALEIMKRLSTTPEETIMVGDAPNDIEMAQRAGCIPVAVLTGHLNTEQAKELGVKFIIPDIRSLPDLLVHDLK